MTREDYTLNGKETRKRLSGLETRDLLKELAGQDNISFTAVRKNTFLLHEDTTEKILIQLPLVFPKAENGITLAEYVSLVEKSSLAYTVILIQAGAGALGCFEQASVKKHKALTRYMVRKKRGKSQLTYLQQKGKSRAGSRIRLRESVEFFEEINRRLALWQDDLQGSADIFYSCPVRLLNELFSSKIAPPFDRQDPRLKKIPFDVRPPNHKELLRINYLLTSGCLLTETKQQAFIGDLP